MAGKGDKPRPLSVSYEEYAESYNTIFGKKPTKKKDEKKSIEDDAQPKGD